MEERNADLILKVDMLQAENERLEASLRRSKDMCVEAQEALDIVENRCASLEGDIEDERKEKASLVAHNTRLEKEVDSVKAASDEAVKAQARGEAERKALSKECERLERP